MKHELAKTLTTALVQFIDRERPEGTMDCSNGECVSLEKAFTEENFDSVETLIKKKLEVPLTPFQQCLNGILRKVFFAEISDPTSFIIKCVQDNTKELLAIAKKELLSYADKRNPAIEAMADLERTYFNNPEKLPKWLKDDIAIKELNAHTKGYTNGYKDATKFYNDSVVYRNPEPVLPGVAYKPPRITDVLITPNTTCGTSTEALHGNTSVTDGKEHNTSFTD